MKPIKINKVQTSLKQLIDVDTSSNYGQAYRVDDVRHNQILIAKVYTDRQDSFRFEYLSNFFAAGTGITLTTDDEGITTITSTATSSGVSTNSNVLIDCGAFLTPNENVLVDCGTF
jgi:hypothetical protein